MAIESSRTRITTAIRGCLAKAIVNVNQTLIYAVSDTVEYVSVNLNISNPSSEELILKIWIADDDVPSDIDLIEPGILLKPNAVYMRSGFVLSKGEKIFMKTNTGNIVARIEGLADRTF